MWDTKAMMPLVNVSGTIALEEHCKAELAAEIISKICSSESDSRYTGFHEADFSRTSTLILERYANVAGILADAPVSGAAVSDEACKI